MFAELRAIDMDATTRVAAIESITTTLFGYIDWISQQVVGVYEDERERWLENQNSVRALQVREVLAGGPIDVDAATTAIRYPLLRHHVALVLWYPDQHADHDELARLQRVARELADAAGAEPSPLFVAADRTTGWVWLSYRTDPGDVTARIRTFARTRSELPSIAMGTAGSGVDGFRRSYRQAMRARAVAVVDDEHAFIAASDPGMTAAALLGANLTELRDWVTEVLGPLASDTPNDERLRETLRVFLRTGSSYKAAAQELNLHFNSVKYRVGRAVARRGRPIADDRLDVELALLVCAWYRSAVLVR